MSGRLFSWVLAGVFLSSLVVTFFFHQSLGQLNDSYATWTFVSQNCTDLEASQAAFGLSLLVCRISDDGLINLIVYFLCFSTISLALVSFTWVFDKSVLHLPAMAYLTILGIFWLGGTKESISILGVMALIMACFRPSLPSIFFVGFILLLLFSRSLAFGLWGMGLTFLCALVSFSYENTLKRKYTCGILFVAILSFAVSFGASSVSPSLDRKALVYGDDAVIVIERNGAENGCVPRSLEIRSCVLEIVKGYSANGRGSSWDYDQEMASLKFGLSNATAVEPMVIAIQRSYNLWSASNLLHVSHSIFCWLNIATAFVVLVSVCKNYKALKNFNRIFVIIFVMVCLWTAWFFSLGLIGSFIPNNNTLIRYVGGLAISVYYFQLYLIGKLHGEYPLHK